MIAERVLGDYMSQLRTQLMENGGCNSSPPRLPPPPIAAAVKHETCSSSKPPSISRKKKDNHQRRFDDEQVKLLESMFETETKLEPRKKVQLARELGLHPRQVAIWFQNKRARWKSKQIEKDYSVLKAKYDNLASQFESLKKERQSLLIQFQNIRDLLEQSHNKDSKDLGGRSTDGGSDNGNTNCEYEVNGSSSKRIPDDRWNTGFEEDRRINIGDTKQEEVENLFSIGKDAYGFSGSFELWNRADACGYSEPSYPHERWWDL